MNKILSKIPVWVGFLLLILVGLGMVINGFANTALAHPEKLGFIIFGLCCLIIGAFSWIVGGTSKITGRSGKVGIKVAISDLPWWGWLVDLIVLITCVALFFILK